MILRKKKERAINLIVDGQLTNTQIARECKISRMTLYRWNQEPEFQARLEAVTAIYALAVRRCPIARREHRLTVLGELERGMSRIIKARSNDPALRDVPGGSTGLIIKRKKVVGGKKNFRILEAEEVDHGLIKSIFSILERARIETLGVEE